MTFQANPYWDWVTVNNNEQMARAMVEREHLRQWDERLTRQNESAAPAADAEARLTALRDQLSPAQSLGPVSTGITGYQGPTWCR